MNRKVLMIPLICLTSLSLASCSFNPKGLVGKMLHKNNTQTEEQVQDDNGEMNGGEQQPTESYEITPEEKEAAKQRIISYLNEVSAQPGVIASPREDLVICVAEDDKGTVNYELGTGAVGEAGNPLLGQLEHVGAVGIGDEYDKVTVVVVSKDQIDGKMQPMDIVKENIAPTLVGNPDSLLYYDEPVTNYADTPFLPETKDAIKSMYISYAFKPSDAEDTIEIPTYFIGMSMDTPEFIVYVLNDVPSLVPNVSGPYDSASMDSATLNSVSSDAMDTLNELQQRDYNILANMIPKSDLMDVSNTEEPGDVVNSDTETSTIDKSIETTKKLTFKEKWPSLFEFQYNNGKVSGLKDTSLNPVTINEKDMNNNNLPSDADTTGNRRDGDVDIDQENYDESNAVGSNTVNDNNDNGVSGNTNSIVKGESGVVKKGNLKLEFFTPEGSLAQYSGIKDKKTAVFRVGGDNTITVSITTQPPKTINKNYKGFNQEYFTCQGIEKSTDEYEIHGSKLVIYNAKLKGKDSDQLTIRPAYGILKTKQGNILFKVNGKSGETGFISDSYKDLIVNIAQYGMNIN